VSTASTAPLEPAQSPATSVARRRVRYGMPMYLYEILDKQGEPTGETFEHFQPMKDDALTKHPETGVPCRRAITAPAIAGKWSDLNKSKMSNENLTRMGFTKYERKGKGHYERTAGKEGPRTLNADD
jgi:predicted nucleic acid-binding Zn ribbon protein